MANRNILILQAVGSGLIGVGVLTVLHETARQYSDEAPRADLLGMRAIRKVMQKADAEPPADSELHQWDWELPPPADQSQRL